MEVIMTMPMNQQLEQLAEILRRVNVTSISNPDGFWDSTRLAAIKAMLAGSKWVPLLESKLGIVYCQPHSFDPHKGIILVSTHIDSLYPNHFCTGQTGPNTTNILQGTFDNSSTNAAIIYSMLRGHLPGQVVVAFTGEEEHGSTGVARMLETWACSHAISYSNIALAVVLDVTFEADYGNGFSVENTFPSAGRRLDFEGMPTFCKWIHNRIGAVNYLCLPVAMTDEAYMYRHYVIPTFSFCLPVQEVYEGGMHAPEGLFLDADAWVKYCVNLENFLWATGNYLSYK
jgi:hypothetical protein